MHALVLASQRPWEDHTNDPSPPAPEPCGWRKITKADQILELSGLSWVL